MYKNVPIFNQMNRLLIAIKAFRLIIISKDIRLSLRYDKKSELQFEEGCFAEATSFLNGIKKRNNFPDYILSQYKEVLTDYNYKE